LDRCTIHLDIDARKLADHYSADVGIWGDAGASLDALLHAMGAQTEAPPLPSS